MIQWSNKKAVAILEETPSALGLLGPHNKMGAPRSDVFFCCSLWIAAAFHAHPWMTLKLRPKQRTIWSRWFGEEQVVALIFLSPRFFRSSIYMASILNFPITGINGSLLSTQSACCPRSITVNWEVRPVHVHSPSHPPQESMGYIRLTYTYF